MGSFSSSASPALPRRTPPRRLPGTAIPAQHVSAQRPRQDPLAVVSAPAPGQNAAGGQEVSTLPRSAPLARMLAAEVARRHPAWHVWFGTSTGQWWAIPRWPGRDILICAPTAGALVGLLRGPALPARRL